MQRGTREGRLPDRGEDHPLRWNQRWIMEWLDPDAKRCNLPCLFFRFLSGLPDRFIVCVLRIYMEYVFSDTTSDRPKGLSGNSWPVIRPER